MKRLLPLTASAVAALAVVPAAPALADPTPEYQLSTTAPNGDTLQPAAFSSVAVSGRTGQAFVAFEASIDDSNSATDIFVQRVGADGARIGGRIQASAADTSFSNNPPSIAYSAQLDEFLVTWDDDSTVYARRLAGDGTPLGGDIVVSDNWNDTETTVPVFNAQANQWYVVFKSVDTSNDQQVWGQRLSTSGALVGTTFDISDLSDHADDAIDVAYAPDTGRMLVVEHGVVASDPSRADVFAELLDADGSKVAGPVQVSDVTGNAQPPRVAYDQNAHRYLVGWVDQTADTGESEIFNQLVDADGHLVGANRQVTHQGPAGNTNYKPARPQFAFNPIANEWLMAWHGTSNASKQMEVYAQRLAADGTPLGTVAQLTDVKPDTDRDLSGNRPSVAYNPASCDWWVTYGKGSSQGENATYDTEIFGRRWLAGACPPPPAPPASTPATTTVAPPATSLTKPPVLRFRVPRTQHVGRNGYVLVRTGCLGPCTISLGGTVSVPGAAKVYRLAGRKLTLKGAGKVTVKVRIGKRAAAAVRRAVRHHRKVTAKLTVVTTDTATHLVSRGTRTITARG